MSHFDVAVFIEPGGKTIEQLMAPYQENNMGDCPEEYLSFVELDEHESYKNGYTEKILKPNGKYVWPWETDLKKDESGKRLLADGYKAVQIKYSELYPTYDDFMKDYHGVEIDKKTGEYGYWENPNAKWDYWIIGGRWCGKLDASNGIKGKLSLKYGNNYIDPEGSYDSALVSNVSFDADPKKYNEAIRFWEVAIEGDPLKPRENLNDFFAFYKPSFYIDRYKNKEIYAQCKSLFSTFAVVTPDGKWHEKGNMGWFGTSNESHDEALDWILHYKERFIDTARPEWTITILDCHI